MSDDVTIFDLMFFGCQSINSPQAKEILEAIKSGKIRGVVYDEDGDLLKQLEENK